MTSATLEQAEAAKRKLLDRLDPASNVAGIGIAILEDGFGVKVNVHRLPAPGQIPDDVDGVPVVVDVVGVIKRI